MKKLLTTMALGLALAGGGVAQAQECLYLVGNMTEWLAPAPGNAEYYEQFKLMPDGEFDGNTIYRGKFEVGNAELPMFRFYTNLDGWGNGENSWGATWDDFQTTSYNLSDMEEGVSLGWGKGNYQLNDWQGGEMFITVCWPTVYVSAAGYIEPHHRHVPELSDGTTMYQLSGTPGIWHQSFYSDYRSYIRVPGTMVGQPDKEWLYVRPAKPMTPDSYGIAVSDFTFDESPVEIDLSGYQGVYGSWSNLVYLDMNNHSLYLNQLTTSWISTSTNNLPFINFSNYKDFDEWKLDLTNNYPYADGWKPLQIDLPAGDFSFNNVYAGVPGEQMGEYVQEWNLEAEHSGYLSRIPQEIYRVNLINNPGGTLLFSFYGYGYVADMEKLYVLTYDGSWDSVPMELKGNGQYEAEVQFSAYESATRLSIRFADRVIGAPGYTVELANGLIFTDGDEVTANCRLAIAGSSLTLPQMYDGGRVKIVFDRNSGKVTFRRLDGELTNLPMLVYNQNGEHIETLMGMLGKGRFQTGWWANYWTETEYFNIKMLDGQNVVPDYSKAYNDEKGYRIIPYTLSKTEVAGLTRPVSKGSNAGTKLYELNTAGQYLKVYDSNSELSDVVIGDGFFAPYSFYVYPLIGYGSSTPLIENYNGELFFDMLDILPTMQKQGSINNDPVTYKGSFRYGNSTDYPISWMVLYIGQAFYPYYYTQFLNGINTQGHLFTYYPDTEDVSYGYLQNYASSYCDPFQIYVNDSMEEGTLIDLKMEIYTDNTVRVYVHFKSGSGIEQIGDGLSALKARGERGQIRIDSAEDAKVFVYDLKGAAILQTEVEAGTTVIGGIAPGLYVVNGEKVLVK